MMAEMYNLRMKAIQITIDEPTLSLLDSDDEAKASGRSAFIRRALQEYFRQKEARATDDAYRRAYASGVKDPDLGPWEEVQAWPEE